MLKRECRGVEAALSGATRCGSWLASGPLRPGVRLRGDDQVFRIGNAAGEAHPIIGEGISMALQSAWLLCARLHAARPRRAADAPANWQRDARQRYTADWREHFLPRLRMAAGLANLAMRPISASALMATLTRFPSLLTRGARWSGKVSRIADSATLGVGLQHLPQTTALPALHRLLPGEHP
jgi:flavin-dependent dehydrogenase